MATFRQPRYYYISVFDFQRESNATKSTKREEVTMGGRARGKSAEHVKKRTKRKETKAKDTERCQIDKEDRCNDRGWYGGSLFGTVEYKWTVEKKRRERKIGNGIRDAEAKKIGIWSCSSAAASFRGWVLISTGIPPFLSVHCQLTW